MKNWDNKRVGLLSALLLSARLAGAQALPVDQIAPAWPEHRELANVLSNVTLGAAVAVDSWHSWKAEDRKHAFLVQGERLGLTLGLTELTKRLIHRTRPDGSDALSFWSGHTAATASMSCSGSTWAFTVGTGTFRIAADRHFLTDVLAGAAVGCLVRHVLH